MSYADLTCVEWWERSDEQAFALAQEIADRYGLRLVELRWHEFAGRRNRLAVFDRDGLLFALVPGGRSVLGYDGGWFRPTPAQAASYADSADVYGPASVAEHLDSVTSPVREVEMPAMLIAIDPFEPCASDLAADDPRVRELVAESGRRPRGRTRMFTPEGGIEVQFDDAGQVSRARVRKRVCYAEAVDRVVGLGLRLSTPDEWEYACGAGARTLFRWGDDTPESGYPDDHRTGPHRQRNLWGLAIGQDPYRHEWTSVPNAVCGGDGGGTICGGGGFFVGWVTIATAYRNAGFGAWLNSDGRSIDELRVRLVLDLA